MVLVGVCLLSSILFAAGNSLQHVGANNLGGRDLPPLEIVARLARNRTWLIGSAVALLAFITHLLALELGQVGVVQPLLLVGIVLAICFRPLLDGARAHVVEILAGLAAVGGLTLYIRAGAIYDRAATTAAASSVLVTAIVVGTVVVVLSSARRLGFDLSLTFGACAGLLMGTAAGLFKEAFEAESLLGWQLPVALALEIVGTFLNQRAYHTGPLAKSMPTLNLVSVLQGGLFGALVFGELPHLGSAAVVGQLVGLGLAGGGLVVLTLHHRERAPRDEPAAERERSRT